MSKPARVEKLETGTYLFICMDGPDTPPLRAKHLFGHLDHIEAHNEKYRAAGPMRENDDGEIVGSFFLVAANSKDEAYAVMNGDPYMASDMYASVTVHHITPACGAWIGGIIWDQDEIKANMEKYTKG